MLPPMAMAPRWFPRCPLQHRGLAAYAAACAKEPRFAADLLLKIDVHDDLDGAGVAVATGQRRWREGVMKSWSCVK